jgi:NADH-quinone oxidoreductase subunit J
MGASTIIFYLGASGVIIFALLSVLSGKLLRSAIYLLFVLVGIAVFYLSIDYMFLAAVQVVVYMGGILVLIIFSILLTSHLNEKLQTVSPIAIAASALTGLIGAGVVISVLLEASWMENFGGSAGVTVEQVGIALLSTTKFGYVLPFEVISILLLAALIAAIVIAKREKIRSDD